MTMTYSNSCLNKKKVFLVIPTDLEIQMDLITLKAQSNAMTECHNKLPLL